MKMKLVFAALIAGVGVSCSAGTFPIRNGKLETDLDANFNRILNLTLDSINVTNFDRTWTNYPGMISATSTADRAYFGVLFSNLDVSIGVLSNRLYGGVNWSSITNRPYPGSNISVRVDGGTSYWDSAASGGGVTTNDVTNIFNLAVSPSLTGTVSSASRSVSTNTHAAHTNLSLAGGAHGGELDPVATAAGYQTTNGLPWIGQIATSTVSFVVSGAGHAAANGVYTKVSTDVWRKGTEYYRITEQIGFAWVLELMMPNTPLYTNYFGPGRAVGDDASVVTGTWYSASSGGTNPAPVVSREIVTNYTGKRGTTISISGTFNGTYTGDGSGFTNITAEQVGASATGHVHSAENVTNFNEAVLAFVTGNGVTDFSNRIAAIEINILARLPTSFTNGSILAVSTNQLGDIFGNGLLRSVGSTSPWKNYANITNPPALDFYPSASGTDTSNRVVILEAAMPTVSRYIARTNSGGEVYVSASRTGVTASVSGSVLTFSIPASTVLHSARIRWNGSGGTSLTIDTGTADMVNTGASNRWGAVASVFREDTGARLATASLALDTANFSKITVNGLWDAGVNNIVICW